MPGPDGLVVANEQAVSGRWQPSILASDHLDPAVLRKAFRLRIVDIVAKPIRLPQLRGIVGRVLHEERSYNHGDSGPLAQNSALLRRRRGHDALELLCDDSVSRPQHLAQT